MTKAKRINKLAHAAKELRGRYDARTGKWMIPPNPARITGVVKWATALGLDVGQTLDKITSFQHIDQFDAWIKTVGEKPTIMKMITVEIRTDNNYLSS